MSKNNIDELAEMLKVSLKQRIPTDLILKDPSGHFALFAFNSTGEMQRTDHGVYYTQSIGTVCVVLIENPWVQVSHDNVSR